jgi:hypothetical protein
MTEPNLKDIIKKEYMKCAMDCEYFLKKYSYIQVPNRGRQLFDLYDYQVDTLNAFQDNRYSIVLKGRQIGISTLIAGYSLWRLLFKKDEQILIIAIKQDVAKNLVNKVKFMHELLPIWLKGTLVEDNKLALSFANGSAIKAMATSDSAGRSESLSLLIFDEAAFIDGAEEIWTAAQATLSTTGGQAVLISTPNGMGNFFHKTWVDSEQGVNDFTRTMLDWEVHPERDQAWADEQLRQMGEMRFAQEHGASFIFSGNTVISPDIIQFYRDTFVQEPLEKRGFDGNLWVWQQPNYSKGYIVAADVARGDGGDYSTFHVIDLDASEQVAEYKGKIPPKEFGNLLVAVATEYNDAIIIPDNSNIGWATIQQIIDRDYRNLFYMSKDLRYVDTMHQMVGRYNAEERKMVPGFTISSRTRPLIVAKLESYMREQGITLRSKRTVTELETFIWKNAKAEALEGYNDDLTMALAIGLWVRDTAMRLRSEGVELNKKMLDNISSTQVKGVWTSDDNNDDHWSIPTGVDEQADIRWLLG